MNKADKRLAKLKANYCHKMSNEYRRAIQFPSYNLQPTLTFEEFLEKWSEDPRYLNTKNKTGPWSYQLQILNFDKPLSKDNCHIIQKWQWRQDQWSHGFKQQTIRMRMSKPKRKKRKLSEKHKQRISDSMKKKKK